MLYTQHKHNLPNIIYLIIIEDILHGIVQIPIMRDIRIKANRLMHNEWADQFYQYAFAEHNLHWRNFPTIRHCIDSDDTVEGHRLFSKFENIFNETSERNIKLPSVIAFDETLKKCFRTGPKIRILDRKPDKKGVLSHILAMANSTMKYCINSKFELCCRAESTRKRDILEVCKRMVLIRANRENIELTDTYFDNHDPWFQLFADKAFGSYDLAKQLQKLGVMVVFLVANNREKSLFTNWMDIGIEKKDFRAVLQSIGGSKSAKDLLTLLSWFDNGKKPVHLIATGLLPSESLSQSHTLAHGNAVPNIIQMYNMDMNKVDLLDAMIKLYSNKHKVYSVKSNYVRFITIIRMCFVNAFSGMQNTFGKLEKYKYLNFLMDIMQQKTGIKIFKTEKNLQQPNFHVSMHFPVRLEWRNKCKYCKTSTALYKCPGCNAYYHCSFINRCFEKAHATDLQIKDIIDSDPTNPKNKKRSRLNTTLIANDSIKSTKLNRFIDSDSTNPKNKKRSRLNTCKL